jgi:hypothetical protein
MTKKLPLKNSAIVLPPNGVKISALPCKSPWSQNPTINVPFLINITP